MRPLSSARSERLVHPYGPSECTHAASLRAQHETAPSINCQNCCLHKQQSSCNLRAPCAGRSPPPPRTSALCSLHQSLVWSWVEGGEGGPAGPLLVGRIQLGLSSFVDRTNCWVADEAGQNPDVVDRELNKTSLFTPLRSLQSDCKIT